MFYRKTVLDNGITVITEHMNSVRSITLGLWFSVGSRDETPQEAGLSHFLEHMMFKGTPSRTSKQISEAFDAMGAQFNAFTSKENTCYYARFVDEHLDEAFEILSDMVINSEFAENELSVEKNVVIEEMKRSEDDNDDQVFKLASLLRFPTHPLGQPILGNQNVIEGCTSRQIDEYHKRHYTTGNLVVAAAGNVNHDDLVSLAQSYLAHMPYGERTKRKSFDVSYTRAIKTVKKDSEQAYIVLELPGLSLDDERRYAARVLATVVGGGMSSRLFQEIREKRGLAYSVFTYTFSYQGVGETTFFVGTRPNNIKEALSVLKSELQDVVENGITQEELERAKGTVVGSLTLSMESTQSRMMRLGKSEISGVDIKSMQEQMDIYNSLTREDIQDTAKYLYNNEPLVAVISSLDEREAQALIERGLA